MHGNKYFGIPSPIEQNKRHIHLFDKFLKQNNILPKRVGIIIKPRYLNYILVSPQSVIKRPNSRKFDTKSVIKADTLETVIMKNAENAKLSEMGSVMKFSSFSTIETVAIKIVQFHRPARINWKAKFGIRQQLYKSQETARSDRIEYCCAKCKKKLSERVARFCLNDKDRFHGRTFCYNCQRLI